MALDGTIPEDARGVESWRLIARVDGEDSHAEASDVFFVGEWMTPIPGEPDVTPTPTRTRAPADPANTVYLSLSFIN